jgi:hypothetical protein
LLLGECKWKNQPQEISVLKKIEDRSNLFTASTKLLYIFAKKSFKKNAIEYAKKNQIQLVTYPQMYDDF